MSLLPWIGYAAAASLAAYTNPIARPGTPGYSAHPRHHLRAVMENDSFVGDDNGYTHGTRVDYAQELGAHNLSFGLSLTQNIYTPDTKTHGNVRGEHPYAGYLAIGGALLGRDENVGISMEWQLGTTGKASLARDAQRAVHSVGDMKQWKGWGEQIPGEVTMQFTSRQDWRLPFLERRVGNRLETDGTFFTREQLGTVALGGAAGLTLRLGRNLPDSMQVNGSEAGNFGMGLLEKPDYHRDALSWFVYVQGQVKFVGRDMFIDGGVFHDFEQTCTRKPWVGELQAGAAVSHEGIDYYMGVVWSSHTYKGEDRYPMHGTCGITWHW